MKWDSNPRHTQMRTGFQDRILKPLEHSSKKNINRTYNIFQEKNNNSIPNTLTLKNS